MYEPRIITLRGRPHLCLMNNVGKYGEKWFPVEVRNASHFSRNGRPCLPPPEWKLLVAIAPLAPVPHTRPKLRLVHG